MKHGIEYAKAIKAVKSLYGVWSPEQTNVLRPGVCGYFDDAGDWNLIADLNNIPPKSFLTPLKLPNPKEKPQGGWSSPVYSNGVSFARVKLEAPITVPNTGVKFETKLEFTKHTDYGASLVTGPSVDSSYLQNPKALFSEWAKANYTPIREKYPDIKDPGLWIISKIYHTRRCAIASWWGSEKSACLYAGAGALEGNSLTLGGAVGTLQQSGIWRILPPPDDPERDQRNPYTIFVGGLRYCRIFWTVNETSFMLPPGQEEFVYHGDGEEEKILCEEWGTGEE